MFDNIFTSSRSSRLLANNGIAATGTLHPKYAEGVPPVSNEKMKKEKRGSHDVMVDHKS